MNAKTSDITWVGIRLFGVYFLICAALKLLEFGVSTYSFYSISFESWGANADLNHQRLMTMLVGIFTYLVFYSGLAYYFLRKGKYLHRFIMRFSSEDET